MCQRTFIPSQLARAILSILPIALAGCQTTGVTATGHERDRQIRKYLADNYTKREYQIPMRDGVKLFTSVMSPKDTRREYPFLIFRTPYSCSPYGQDEFPTRVRGLGHLIESGYIFVTQDVRGKYMSEGEFVNMRPHIDDKQSPTDIDESSDTYDTIEWLLENVPNHNGRAGMWGISYPGFYAAAGMIDAHPALKAVSPQAPIADWYFDDFYHHGAFFLPHFFGFFYTFGQARPEPTTESGERFDYGTPDGYQFYMDLGPLKNIKERYYKDDIAYWDQVVAHPTRDAFWKASDILPHLHNVAPAVMTVGGWFDAEDLYGPLNIYRSVEEKNPDAFNVLVMGPWRHGGWARTDGDSLGQVRFGDKTSAHYKKNIELAFFDHFLKDEGRLDLPEAYVYETGANRWRQFDHWPPQDLETRYLYARADGELSFEPPVEPAPARDEFVSDPAKPVPFTEAISNGMTTPYMTDDQRFAGRRPDVLVYQTEPLTESVTLAGPMQAQLWVSTTGTAADWVVKLIDVLPPDTPDNENTREGHHMGGYQQMVRSEIIRGRYRNSYEHPEPFTPDQVTEVSFTLQDVLHTFEPGHRIMIQIQSTWFPLVDRNPQKYVDNIFEAEEEDFIKATHRIHRSADHATRLKIGLLVEPPTEVAQAPGQSTN